jgi:hypothetical protein
MGRSRTGCFSFARGVKATTGLVRACARVSVQEQDRVGARASGEEGFPSAAKPRPVAGRSADEVRREREPKAWT